MSGEILYTETCAQRSRTPVGSSMALQPLALVGPFASGQIDVALEDEVSKEDAAVRGESGGSGSGGPARGRKVEGGATHNSTAVMICAL